jgi:hypothetical protein
MYNVVAPVRASHLRSSLAQQAALGSLIGQAANRGKMKIDRRG